MTHVVCIGECMVEFRAVAGQRHELGFAGDVLNTAVYLKRSAPELSVSFLTVTGTDPLSAAMRGLWRDEDIAQDLAFSVADAIPGLYVIGLDPAGERSFTYWRSASAARRWFDVLLREGGAERLGHADLIYCSGISLAILPHAQQLEALRLLASLQRRGCRIAFDPNYRSALWPSLTAARELLGAAVQLADIVLPSQEDLDAVGLAETAVGEWVTTCGARGCRVAIAGSSCQREPPDLAGSVVDTSGAGDAFNGAYLAARLRGVEPFAAADAGLAVARRVVTATGAIVSRDISHPRLQVP